MDANKGSKTGFIIIVAGVCLPIVFLPFVSLYDGNNGIVKNILTMTIAFTTDSNVKSERGHDASTTGRIPLSLPFRYVIALGVVLIFIGIVKIDRSRKDEDNMP